MNIRAHTRVASRNELTANASRNNGKQGGRPANPIDVEACLQRLIYDPETGEFRHRVNGGPRARAGAIAGTTYSKRGYRRLKVNGKWILAHRVAWAMTYGHIDEDKVIDHIDHNPANNRLSNLRCVTDADNGRNMSRRSNRSGFTGVDYHQATDRWRARVCVDGKSVYVGYFSDAVTAARAVAEKRQELGFHNNHGTKN